jgi:branched-chain amino acid transport system substrate-binding protein
MRKLLVVTLVLVLMLSVVLVPVAQKSAQAQDGEPLKIGVLADLSAALAIYGFELQYGFELGVEYATEGTMEVAGRPVEIIVRDYANDAELAASQARELIEVDGVEVLVGAPSSGVTQGLVDVAAEFDVILMAGPAADPGLTGAEFEPTTFRACRNSSHDWMAIAPYAVETLGATKYAELAPDYAFGHGSVAAAHYAFDQFDEVEFVQDPIYAPTDTTDFVPYLQELIDSGAEVALLTWAGGGAITLFAQAFELGLGTDPDKPVVITGYNSNDIVQGFFTDEYIGSEGLIVYHYTLPDTEINDWLVERHREKYDDVPDLFTECGFASAQALIAGIEMTDGSTFTEDLIPALEGLEWEGPKGTYYMRPEDHQALMPIYIVRLTNLDDPDFAFYELVEAIPIDDLPCESGADRSSDTLDCTPLAERE